MTTLSTSKLPAVYRVADETSLAAQSRFLGATRLRLGALVGAALFGLFVWRTSRSPVDWAGALALACFLAAIVVETYLLSLKPERTWYEARAAAESVKTLSWRYMMAAEPFAATSTSVDAEQMFLARVGEVLGVLKDLDLAASHVVGEQITSHMRDVRQSSLAARKRIYEQERVRSQQEWYSTRANENRKRADAWLWAMLITEFAGAIAAVLKAVGTIEGDLLGFAGAFAASMSTWLQTKQHRTIATAYAVTAIELASVRSRISHQTTEVEWAAFVSNAEDAFSREHTLWKASRGVTSK